MKKLIYIIPFLLVTSLQAQFFNLHESNLSRKYVYSGAMLGIIMVPLYDYNYHMPFKANNGLYLSPGIDLSMLSDGFIDVRAKAFYKLNRFEPGINAEYFKWAKYKAIGLQCNYAIINRKLSLYSGPEVSYISNINGTIEQRVISIGFNVEQRYYINDRISISYIGNFKTRPELSESKPDLLFSGYVNININLNN